jgi:hypothetical protein
MKGNTPKRSIVSSLFSLDYPNYRILEYFAKNGKSNRNQVGKHNTKYKPLLTEKQIGRRVESLEQLGYLQQTGVRAIGNLKDKVEKVYDLTLKGFLASLHYCELEENQVFRKYIEFIDNVDLSWRAGNVTEMLHGNLKKLSPIITELVNLQLDHFFSHNYIRGITLDSMKDIPSWFDVYDNPHGIPSKDLKLLEKLQDKIVKVFEEIDYNNDENSYHHQDVFLWINWIHVLSFISQGITTNKILLKLRREFPSPFVTLVRKEKQREFEEEMVRIQEVDRKASDIFYRRKSRV